MTTVYVSEENLKSLVHHKLHTAGLDADTAQCGDRCFNTCRYYRCAFTWSYVEHYCTLTAGGLNKAP